MIEVVFATVGLSFSPDLGWCPCAGRDKAILEHQTKHPYVEEASVRHH